MQYIFGIKLKNNEAETISEDGPDKGLYALLHVAVKEARRQLEQNPDIRRINIYRCNKEQKLLMHAISRVGNLICG